MRTQFWKFFPLAIAVFLLVPPFGQCDEIVPGGSIVIVGCVWPPYSGIKVTFQTYYTAYSGFHSHHDVYRPSGSMNPQVAYTGADGYARSTYRGPDVSGSYEIASFCDFGSDFLTMDVRVSWLSSLPDHPDYIKTGSQPEHPDGWWGTENAVSKIGMIAAQFRQETGLRTGVNDMSIQWDGRFDLGPRYGRPWWGPPHDEHMWGLNADIPYAFLGTLAQRERFRVIAGSFGGNPLPEPDRSLYHLRFSY